MKQCSIKEIKQKLKYIEERNKVCCTFGCEGEKEELLEKLENMKTDNTTKRVRKEVIK